MRLQRNAGSQQILPAVFAGGGHGSVHTGSLGVASDCSVKSSVLLNQCHMARLSLIRDRSRVAQLSPSAMGISLL